MVKYIFKYTETDQTGQSEDREKEFIDISRAFGHANLLIYDKTPFYFYSVNIIEVSPNIVAPEGYSLFYDNILIDDPSKLVFRKV
jgi:hypothetical protein